MTLADKSADFFAEPKTLVQPPNGDYWWHSLPLPGGRRMSGVHDYKLIQADLWRSFGIPRDGLVGKNVLDIGANDGYFTLASIFSGAERVTAINAPSMKTFPKNIDLGCEQWGVAPRITVGDFTSGCLIHKYDVILCLGIIYHQRDIFTAFQRLAELLADDGVIYLETQTTTIESHLPLFECASDVYPTTIRQYHDLLNEDFNSNYLLPNDHAIHALAGSFGLTATALGSVAHPTRHVFRLRKTA